MATAEDDNETKERDGIRSGRTTLYFLEYYTRHSALEKPVTSKEEAVKSPRFSPHYSEDVKIVSLRRSNLMTYKMACDLTDYLHLYSCFFICNVTNKFTFFESKIKSMSMSLSE